MIRTWTEVGKQHSGTEEAKAGIQKAIDGLDWSIKPGDELPMMPGLAINKLLKEFNLPKVSWLAISSDLAPYGFYGIEANYRNGRARICFVDEGSRLVPVVHDFFGKIAGREAGPRHEGRPTFGR